MGPFPGLNAAGA